MKASLLDFFAAAANGASVHIGHRLEKGGIQLDGVFRFGESEFGNCGIELQLQTLQNDGVKDIAFRAQPAQDAISQDKLDALGFTVDAAIERIKGLEEAHRLPRGLLCSSPFVPKGRPAAKCA